MTYARRRRMEANPHANRDAFETTEELAVDILSGVAAFLAEYVSDDQFDNFTHLAAQFVPRCKSNPTLTAALMAYMAMRIVEREGLTPDAMSVKHESTGKDNG